MGDGHFKTTVIVNYKLFIVRIYLKIQYIRQAPFHGTCSKTLTKRSRTGHQKREKIVPATAEANSCCATITKRVANSRRDKRPENYPLSLGTLPVNSRVVI